MALGKGTLSSHPWHHRKPRSAIAQSPRGGGKRGGRGGHHSMTGILKLTVGSWMTVPKLPSLAGGSREVAWFASVACQDGKVSHPIGDVSAN